MDKQELFETLHCKSLYVTGSSANPYIKNPRDTEYYAIFENMDDLKNAPKIYNVHKITKDYKYARVFLWSYLFHYLNESNDYLGEKFEFEEADLTQLTKLANHTKKIADALINKKIMYHVAMIDAINEYGYDDIPEEVVQRINDLHDLKINYNEQEN